MFRTERLYVAVDCVVAKEEASKEKGCGEHAALAAAPTRAYPHAPLP
jgi:hypothetical protein